MINLPISNYTWFPVVPKKYFPLYIAFSKIKCILDNSNFIIKLIANKDGSPAGKYRKTQSDYIALASDRLNKDQLDQSLKLLHLSPLLEANTFLPIDKRKGMSDPSELWLMAERFYWDHASFNLGSSRHILIHTLQLKGCGRNPMAIRPDFSHSWGGCYLWQNLKAICFNILYQDLFPMGIQKVAGVSIFLDEFIQEDTKTFELNSMLIREAKTYRLAQLMSGLDSNNIKSKREHQKHITDLLDNTSPSYLTNLYYQYGSMLALGFKNINITKENVTIDGSLIDYEDITYLGNEEFQDFEIKFYYEGKIDDKVLSDYLADCSIYTSPYHLYLDAVKMSQKTINKFLDENYNFDLKKEFINFLVRFKNNIYDFPDSLLDMIHELSNHEEIYQSGISYFQLQKKISDNLYELVMNHEHKHVLYEKIDEDRYIVSVVLSYTRGVWLNSHLEKYYQNIKTIPVPDLTVQLLKIANIYLQEKEELDINTSLAISSKFNHLISLNSWLLPYRYQDESFSLIKYSSINEIKDEIERRIEIDGITIHSFFGVEVTGKLSTAKQISHDELQKILDSGNVYILQGVEVEKEDFFEQFVPACLYISL